MEYDLILADPPWRYRFSRSASRQIENQYETMTLDDVAALPVASWAAPDSVLLLWATAPKLLEALHVMDAWGFKYTTQAVWDKKIIGMGYYWRGQHEILLLGKRGSPPVPPPAMRAPSVMRERRGRHSAKPAISYQIIEHMYPDARKLEMFARAARPGWDVWGAEAPGAVAL
jgi:N6-adenosine-specific RNA methylase IME4